MLLFALSGTKIEIGVITLSYFFKISSRDIHFHKQLYTQRLSDKLWVPKVTLVLCLSDFSFFGFYQEFAFTDTHWPALQFT